MVQERFGRERHISQEFRKLLQTTQQKEYALRGDVSNMSRCSQGLLPAIVLATPVATRSRDQSKRRT